MKSQRIRIRNLPVNHDDIEKTIQLKPTLVLIIMLLAGFAVTVLKPYLLITGLSMILMGSFALWVMPDGKLCEVRRDYIVLYNNPGTDYVTLVYWDELMNWSYERHSAADLLILDLEDGSTEYQELYSRFSIARSLKKHAGGKELRVRKGAF